MLSADSIE